MITSITTYQIAVKEDNALSNWKESLESIDMTGCNAVVVNGVILFGFIPSEIKAKEIYLAITGEILD
ncbi:coil containing protein [Vibrio phage 1.273.O._10N.286.54.C7]|nr:coil containing protein [Vibrio phage 1.273.O._10N.286.54.C7]